MGILGLNEPAPKCVCGRRLFREDKFCGSCGRPVPAALQETAPLRLDEILDYARGTAPSPSATSWRIVTGILASALLLSLLMHRPLTLKVARPLSNTASSQLGKAAQVDISGEWRSLDGVSYEVRVEDRHVYLVPPKGTWRGILGCELSGDGDKYQGTCKTGTFVHWYDHNYRLWQGVCPFEGKIEFANPSSTRIGARVETRGIGTEWSDQDKSTCGKRVPIKWVDLVLIRPD